MVLALFLSAGRLMNEHPIRVRDTEGRSETLCEARSAANPIVARPVG